MASRDSAPPDPAGSADPAASTPAAPGLEPPRLQHSFIREVLVTDKDDLGKGRWLFDQGLVGNLGRFQGKLFGEARGAGDARYAVSVSFGRGEAAQAKVRCTCAAARSRPFCKHAAALLIAWATAPDSFARSESGPAAPEEARARRVKAGKTDKAAVMGAGVAQVVALVRELAVAGVTGVDEGRVAQIRALGDSLRESKLRRLAARTVELSALLDQAARKAAAFQPGDYADHLCDMLLTARKLEKHLGGEPLDDRYVEELIGKTWTEKERRPVADLHLVEYSFSSFVTTDGFLVRESRFLDLKSGAHYSEKQIVPSFLKNVPPKRSYLGQVLAGASGGVYPGFAPLRLKIESAGEPLPLSQAALAALVASALPGVHEALAAFQEQRKDLFAPAHQPVALRVAALLAEGATLRVIDDAGHALALPTLQDPGLEARLATLLRGSRLRALLGRLDVDNALPTLHPLSAVVEGPLGLQLQPLTAPSKEVEGRSRRAATGAARGAQGGGGGSWIEIARRLGASPAAVALEEVREGLAQALVQGLVALQPRAAEPLALRLADLGLSKPAQLLRELLARPDAAARLDDFVKLYQVLEVALVRLCAAGRVELGGLLPVPTYESVRVRDRGEALDPREVMQRRTRGQLGRYEAAVHYARFYDGLRAEDLLQAVLPTWADGGAVPFVVRALSRHGAAAVAAAEQALAGKSYMAKATAVEVLRAIGDERALGLLSQVARGDFGRPRSFGKMGQAYWYWEWGGTIAPLVVRAQDALDAIALGLGGARPRVSRAAVEHILERRRKHQAQLQGHLLQLNGPTAQERTEAVRQLAKLGDLEGAAPALRLCAQSDDAKDVRYEATVALGLLGDGEMVEHFTALLAQREADPDGARYAAYALGYLGDSRGIAELLVVFEEDWQPGVVAEALRAVGEVILTPLIDLLQRRPALLSRRSVQDVLKQLPAAELAEHLAEQLLGRLRAEAALDAEAALQAGLQLAAPNKDVRGKLLALLRERLPQEAEAARAAVQAAIDAAIQKENAAQRKPRRGTQMM